jgi:hypothetical protein
MLRVGCAGALNLIYRSPNSGPRGSMTCSKCKTGGHLALHPGDLCPDCYLPKRINPKYIAKKRVLEPASREQTPETISTINVCVEMMEKLNLPRTRFANELGLSGAAFDLWYKGLCGPVGQANTLKRVQAGLRRLIKRQEVAA